MPQIWKVSFVKGFIMNEYEQKGSETNRQEQKSTQAKIFHVHRMFELPVLAGDFWSEIFT